MSHGLCLSSSFDLKPTAVAVALALTVGPASAATIVADEVTCSLIDAIVAANSNSAVNGCTAGDDVNEGGDVIVLNADVVLASVVDETDGASGLPSITSLITIDGNGHAVSRSSVSGTPEFRVLHVGPAGELTLNDLGLHGGQQSYGGGLANSGTTVLHDSVISGNGGGITGGVYNTGTLTLVDSEVSENWGDFGGGIANLGTLALERSSVSGNSADLAAGGIHNSGILTATNSSISDNGTTYDAAGLENVGDATIIASTITGNGAGRGRGGGIDNGGTLIIADTTISNNGNASGGGLFNGGSGTATLVNSTVSDNTAGSPFGAEVGGGIFNEGTLALTSCTLSDNRGLDTFAPEGEDPHTYGNGLLNGRFGSATLTNTLIANSLFGDCVNQGGTVAFGGRNLIEDGGCNAVAEGQRVGDPKLGPLADNGGPTLTHALLPGSPAIDAGDPDFIPPPEFDQRGEGFVRVYNERIDIGSFELQPLSQPFGSITADQNWTDLCRADMTDAVVLLGAPTHDGGDPGVARMQPKDDAACPYQVRFQEWDYRARDFNDLWHKPEQVPYLGVAPGVYPMDDGSIWEVGTFEHSGTGSWRTVPFESNFAGTPALFLTMQSTNGGQAATVRARNVGPDGFEAAIFEEEYLMDGHAKERIGYVAIYHPDAETSPSVEGLATLNGVEVAYGLTRTWINHNWTSVDGTALHLEEEQSLDDEVVHKNEMVDVLTIGDQVFAQQVSSYGRDTTAIRRE